MSRVQTPPRPSNQAAKPFDPNESLLDDQTEKTISTMDVVALRYANELANPALGQLKRAVLMGVAIRRLREMITAPVMDILRSLQNTETGFLTDRGGPRSKDKTPYDDETIRNCAVEALLRGLYWHGNEWNIIGHRCMTVQNGWRRKCKDVPGVSDLKLSYGGSRQRDGQWYVPIGVRWKLNGVADQLENGKGEPGREFPIACHTATSGDALIGKAIRKGYKAAYEQMTGSAHTEDDEDDETPAVMAAAPVPDPLAKPETMEELDLQMRRVGVVGNAAAEFIKSYSSPAGEITEAAALAAIKELAGMEDLNQGAL